VIGIVVASKGRRRPAQNPAAARPAV